MRDIILLASHFLGDFVLQPRSIATTKLTSFKAMLKHVSILFLVLLAAGLSVSFSMAGVWFAVINATAHLVIDETGWRIYHHYRSHDDIPNTQDYWYYFTLGADQLTHMIVLLQTANVLL